MAYDKVVDSAQLDADLKVIADAIREKGGTTELLEFPQGMKQAVEDIQTGVTKPEQEKTISITENGTTEVIPDSGKVLSKVTVNVEVESGGGDNILIDSLIDGSIAEISSNVIEIATQTFNTRESLVKASFPNCEYVNNSAFYQCIKLKSVELPKVITLGASAFGSCRVLEKLDLHSIESIGGTCFQNCHSLKILALRKELVVPLVDTTVFKNCHHYNGFTNPTWNPDGLKDGYIYVPSSVIENYKVATNWSTYSTQFRALEDYTVDGTITGELDESKI